MPRLIWSPEALADITRLHAFLKFKSPAAAVRAITAIRQGVRLLGEHPHAGRPAREMPLEFREWAIGFGDSGDLALSRLDSDNVVILAVRHMRESGD